MVLHAVVHGERVELDSNLNPGLPTSDQCLHHMISVSQAFLVFHHSFASMDYIEWTKKNKKKTAEGFERG